MNLSIYKSRYIFIVCVFTLFTFGLIMLYSTSSPKFGQVMFKKQIVYCIIGCIVAFFLQFPSYKRLEKYATVILITIIVPLLYLVLANFLYKKGIDLQLPLTGGKATKGSFRWLKLGFLSIQPSEFLKIGVFFFLSSYYAAKQRYVQRFWKGFLLPFGIAGFAALTVLLGGDLSMTVITTFIVIIVGFVAGVRVRFLTLVLLLGVVGVITIAHLSPERFSRFKTYQVPEKYPRGDGYQLWLSELALGSGGFSGIGFTNSRMKELYLPDAHTDFILAIIGEELGFIGISFVMLLYLGLLAGAVGISINATDRLGTYLGCGCASAIFLSAFFNIGVVCGYLPTTGITAPLLSYGGSNMMSTFICIGLLLNIARQSILEIEGTPHSLKELKIGYTIHEQPKES
ncbi:MAG: putative peptidoglycan glycosyltransferase FtsW [Verrucomicrobiota bacterium]|nr:putative peptidoglycan glycosyltransferase FtsW [Verrucomicrobiota bacterium]